MTTRPLALLIACLGVIGLTTAAAAQDTATITLRGKAQTLRLSGNRQGEPVIVSSGDGGWVHLAPHVADTLAARGYFVIGFDARAYLSSFTEGGATLRPEDEPGDFETLARYAAAAGGRGARPLLIGVSEGAGLSVLAATEPKTRTAIGGVIALGLPDVNELGWRWRDAIIYVTKGVPREPVFHVRDLIARVTPSPLAIIASTHDEFMTLTDTRALFDAAKDPKRLWTIEAADHRFSNSLDEFDRRLIEAIAWIRSAR